MTELLVGFFLIFGAALMLLAAIGIIRLPDLPTRMHATTKSGALGTSLIMIGVAVYFADVTVVTRVIAIIAFIILTAPVAAHVIGRAGYFVGVPLWEGTVKDDLRKNYDPETHSLSSGLDKPISTKKTNKPIKPNKRQK
ncbi:monovalent cation/H(+) antiporter subunit G [Methylophaga sp.]|uniref:monovalent cation/H(+) antiporter subunit G n=1 Tax=Methylophaga sp. TaxID=2024840 RepID=UPI00271E80CA|nr:monovalent cation/H(+) antiporter subunit G [Methylophaga sp.]MDO8825659.1 monovalent cation/H(+) antiporter subunit G [Methylophaga sp.]